MNTFLIVSLIFLSILNGCLVYVIYRAWNWRKRLNENTILLPDQFYKDLEIFNNNVEGTKKELESLENSISDNFKGFNSTLSSTVNKNAEYFHNIYDSLTPLKKMIEKQDKELQRFKEGYDNSIKQKIIIKLFDLKKRIKFYTNPSNNSSSSVNISDDVIASSKNILKVLDYVFKTEGVKKIEIHIGSSVDDISPSEVDLLPQNSVKTKDVSLVGTIKNIIEDGYLFEGLDENVYILKKAVVEFYIEDKENG